MYRFHQNVKKKKKEQGINTGNNGFFLSLSYLLSCRRLWERLGVGLKWVVHYSVEQKHRNWGQSRQGNINTLFTNNETINHLATLLRSEGQQSAQILHSLTRRGTWTATISILKPCSLMLQTSDKKRFQSALIFYGFHNHSASFTDKKGWRYKRGRVVMKARSNYSKLLWKNTEDNLKEEATLCCNQRPLLKRLVWMLL